MKRIALFLFSLCGAFGIGFGLSRFKPEVDSLLAKNKLSQEKHPLTFPPSPYPIKNHSFVILLISHNNGATAEKTIQSILSQTYENFRVIYIDNGSSDGSGEHARELIYDHEQGHKVQFIQNEYKIPVMRNLVRAIEACEDEEIVVLLGEEDRLSHEWVLQRLNQYYANPDLWMTLSQYMTFPTFSLGDPSPTLGEMRNAPQSYPQLKTFYAALFKRIDEADLTEAGKWLPDQAEVAYLAPLLEMAKSQIEFVPEVLSLVSKREEISPEIENLFETCLKDKPSYTPLRQLKERA